MSSTRSVFILLAVWQLAAAAQPANLSIAFKPVFGGQPVDLGRSEHTTETGDQVVFDHLRFYAGEWLVTYADGSEWSGPHDYFLVDARSADSLRVVLADAPAGAITRLQFTMGVDSATNHGGAHAGALDPINGMYWTWNTGYIGAKLEGRSPSCKTHRHAFEFHIGGFMAGQRADRRIKLDLSPPQNNPLVIEIDLQQWIGPVALSQTNSIVVPGPEAMKMADRFPTLFSLSKP